MMNNNGMRLICWHGQWIDLNYVQVVELCTSAASKNTFLRALLLFRDEPLYLRQRPLSEEDGGATNRLTPEQSRAHAEEQLAAFVKLWKGENS